MFNIYKVLSLSSCCKVRTYNSSLFVFCTYMYILYALLCVWMFPCVLTHIYVSAHIKFKIDVGCLSWSLLYFLKQDLLVSPEFKVQTCSREHVFWRTCPCIFLQALSRQASPHLPSFCIGLRIFTLVLMEHSTQQTLYP